MSLIDVEIDATDVTAELARLERQTSTAGLTRFLEDRAWPWLEQRTQERFASEGDDASGAWAELLAATNVLRRRQGFAEAHPINVRSGDLKAYALTKTIESQTNDVVLSQPMKGGSRLTQQKFNHAQRGGTMRPGGPPYPPRPVVALNDGDAHAIVGRLYEWVVAGGGP